MQVFDLRIDEDRTTRSQIHSYGLFSTRKKADEYRKSLNLPDYAYWIIVERTVK